MSRLLNLNEVPQNPSLSESSEGTVHVDDKPSDFIKLRVKSSHLPSSPQLSLIKVSSITAITASVNDGETIIVHDGKESIVLMNFIDLTDLLKKNGLRLP